MLKKFFGRHRSKKERSIELSPGLRATIMTALNTTSLPSMPSSARLAFRLAVDPTATARDFIEVIESDEALSARVIKIANSVYFERGQKSETIEECVNVIGLNELRCLLNANTLPELLPSSHPARPALWANDIATALFAREIASVALPSHTSTAFMAGLMHDIGKLLMLQRLGRYYTELLKLVKTEGMDFCSAEREILAFDHCEVGYMLGEKWNFTEDLLIPIREHHLDWDSLVETYGAVSTVGIVKAADTIAHSFGIGFDVSFSKLKNNCSELVYESLERVGLRGVEKKEFLDNLLKVYEFESSLYMSFSR